jgi:uncharacterized membrane protein YheB (UPF0754 family)
MSDVKQDKLKQRRDELARMIANDLEQAQLKSREAAQHRLDAEHNQIRVDEIDSWLENECKSPTVENVIHLHKPTAKTTRSKPILRYRTPGATTDIVMLVYSTPGIAIEQLITEVSEKYKAQGTSRDTISKMVNRLIRERYAYREGSKIYLTDVCKRAWEASPLYLAS